MQFSLIDLRLSMSDFLDLTPWDLHLLIDRHFEKIKEDAQLLRNVIVNAEVNVKRKKGTSEIPLFEEGRKMTIEEKIEERKELFG
ncbi:hypothetical protein ABNF65_15880 [Paenibacillus larvae]